MVRDHEGSLFGGFSDIPWGGAEGYSPSTSCFIFCLSLRGARDPSACFFAQVPHTTKLLIAHNAQLCTSASLTIAPSSYDSGYILSQVALGQKQTAVHRSISHMVAFGASHDLVVRSEADGIGGAVGSASGRLFLGQAYYVPAAFGGAAASAGWDHDFRVSEIEVYHVRHVF